MTLLKPSRTRLHDDMVRAEHTLETASATAMRWFLARITDEALNSQTALVAAATPRNGLTLGEAEGWWTRTVDDRMLDPIATIWQAGWSAHSTGKILSTSNDEFATFMARVRDRLVRGLTPSLPDDAFNTIRHVITTGGSLGWSTQQTAQRIAKELAWEKNAGYWRTQRSLADGQINKLLDPLGPPGSRAREAARLNDARVRALQADRSRAVLALDRDASHWEQRANLIARTESVGAYNYGAWNALAAEGVGCKSWLSTRDAKTRPSHAMASGQTVPMRKPFIVGGYPMMHPGAPTAPPEEVCNCRCAMIGADCPTGTKQAREQRTETEEMTPTLDPASFGSGTEFQKAAQVLADSKARYNTKVGNRWHDYQQGSGDWSYRNQNTILRGPDNAARRDLVATWNKIFDQLGQTTTAPIKLYRGLLGNTGTGYFKHGKDASGSIPEWAKLLKPGSVFVDDGVVSTTASSAAARGWLSDHFDSVAAPGDSVVLELLLPAGTRTVGGHANTFELMLKPGTKTRVVKNELRASPKPYPGKVRYITLEVLP